MDFPTSSACPPCLIISRSLVELAGDSNVTGIVSEPLKLGDLIAYQREAIVSRTLVDEEGGTVTLFAFDEGQGLSEHTAPFDALVIAVEGEVDVTVSGKVFHLKQGEVIMMPANEPHALKAVTEFRMILVMIRAKRKGEGK